MTPAELRAEAKALRKRAKELDREAESIELAAAAEHRRLNSRAAHEAKAATMCRPVWKSDAWGTVCVVVGIEEGCFLVRDLMVVGGLEGPHLYRCRDGFYRYSPWVQVPDAVRRARLDHVATMLAWRAWCAERKSGEPVAPPLAKGAGRG